MDKSITDKLEEVKALYNANEITQEEYEQARQHILSGMNEPQGYTTSSGTFIGLESNNEYGPSNARFILLEELARGGMASVWKAKDIEESKRSGKESIKALKFLHPDFAHSKAHFKRLQREAGNAKKLRHPNIVSVYGFEQGPDGHLFLIMEYLEGRDLAEVLVDEGKGSGLTWDKIKKLMSPVAEALHYAHTEHNIIHRDIKPDNIFLTRDNKIKVLDFGLSEELKLSGSKLGIKADERCGLKVYWAPEICKQTPLATTRDVYAFTAVIYELLTESPPFPEEQVCERKADSFATKPASISDAVWTELEKGLIFNPEKRPEEIQAFWRSVTNPKRAKNSQSKPKKYKVLTSLLAIGVIGIAIAGGLYLKSTFNPSPDITANVAETIEDSSALKNHVIEPVEEPIVTDKQVKRDMQAQIKADTDKAKVIAKELEENKKREQQEALAEQQKREKEATIQTEELKAKKLKEELAVKNALAEENEKLQEKRLFIITDPEDAEVRILNIKPKYTDGIFLKPGKYKIEVSKQSYYKKIKWVTVSSSNKTEKISLEKKPLVSGFFPTSPAFPHGQGITRRNGACNASDNGCPSGLPFPSFNNYLDSGQGLGINDERKFLSVQNITVNPGGTKMKNRVFVKPGDYIYLRAYIHNNGHINDSATTAKKVKIGVEGFSKVGSDVFQSDVGSSIPVRFFISSKNTNPRKVSDDVRITSKNGQKIRLEYRKFSDSLKATNYKPIPAASFFSSGTNLGDIKGADTVKKGNNKTNAFYVQLILRAVEAVDNKYDLNIEKTINGKKVTTVKIGDTLTYKLFFSNIPESTATASTYVVYDDYDQSKIRIINKPDFCKDNGDILTCATKSLPPNNGRYLFYTAVLKKGVKGDIKETATIKSRKDINHKNNASSTVIHIK